MHYQEPWTDAEMDLETYEERLERLNEEGGELVRKLMRGEYSESTARDAAQDKLEWISNEMERLSDLIG